MTQDDQSLFRGITKGSVEAYETLFRKYYTSLTMFAYQIVEIQEEAEEIVQDVFVYLWQKRQHISIKTSVKSYLYTAVKYKCFNYIKLERPRLMAQTDVQDMATSVSTEDPEHLDLLKKKINAAIQDLPERCREIFVLSRYGGLTYAEIAEELDVSVKTVENQISIALKKLRESIGDVND